MERYIILFQKGCSGNLISEIFFSKYISCFLEILFQKFQKYCFEKNFRTCNPDTN